LRPALIGNSEESALPFYQAVHSDDADFVITGRNQVRGNSPVEAAVVGRARSQCRNQLCPFTQLYLDVFVLNAGFVPGYRLGAALNPFRAAAQ
jgi:hypothetical protein